MAEQAGKWRLEMRPLTPAAGARQFRASDWCGARERGSQPRTRAASGLRPEALRPPARSWLTEAVRQLRLADVSRPKGRTKAGSESPEPATKARPDAVRKTPRWSAGRRGVRKRTSPARWFAPTGAPSPSPVRERGKRTRRSPRAKTSGRRSVGCLIIESVMQARRVIVANPTVC